MNLHDISALMYHDIGWKSLGILFGYGFFDTCYGELAEA